MVNSKFSAMPVLGLMLCAPYVAHARVIQGIGAFNAPGKDPGFSRGMQSTMYCSNNPESWVRGSASLDNRSGAVIITAQLETDSGSAGPKGIVTVSINNARGQTLATLTTNELGIPGKGTGHADIRNFSANQSVPTYVARRAATVSIVSQCTGSESGNAAVTQAIGVVGTAIAGVKKIITELGRHS